MTKSLHLAGNFEELTKLAQKNFKNFKPSQLCKSAEKLFIDGLRNVNNGDEEMAYIYFLRFILIYEHLERLKTQKDYTKIRLAREYTMANEHLDQLRVILPSRYDEKQKADEPLMPLIEEPIPTQKINPIIQFQSGYITCSELFHLLHKHNDLVILDSRPKNDYLESSMKHSSCVNIPEEIIKLGYSANILSEQVPEESKSQWNNRWKSSLTILIDWSSTKETITATKLSVLKDILISWDTCINNNNLPVVLHGGYLDWLQKYPMYCTNPYVVYEIQNSVLNDLSDFDTIEYPSTVETIPGKYPKSSSQQPLFDRATKPAATQEKVLTLQENVFNKEKELELKQIEYEKNMEELMKTRQQAAEENRRLEFEQREEKLLEDKEALEKKQLELDEENEKLRTEVENLKTILDKQKLEAVPENLDVRLKLLQDAREKKKSLNITDIDTFPPENKKYTDRLIPEYDRKRPSSNVIQECEPGTSGIFNYGNTCYINSVIQCLVQTRILYLYFSDDKYVVDINQHLGTCGFITREFAYILRSLWSGEKCAIYPNKFRNAITQYSAKFDNSEQHDAHEFLLAMFDWIHEDLKQAIDRPRQVAWTPAQQSWVREALGNHSVIMATFFGQIRNRTKCMPCNKEKSTYEMFSQLSVSLPPNGSTTLESCIANYFKEQQIQDFLCPDCKKTTNIKMTGEIASFPPVLVVLLKRFCQKTVRGVMRLVKNDMTVNYPLDNLIIFNKKYYLYAVIVHIGTLHNGHYFSYCRHLQNNKWYKYNDDQVTEVHKSQVLQPIGAFVLFYRTRDEERRTLHLQKGG